MGEREREPEQHKQETRMQGRDKGISHHIVSYLGYEYNLNQTRTELIQRIFHREWRFERERERESKIIMKCTALDCFQVRFHQCHSIVLLESSSLSHHQRR